MIKFKNNAGEFYSGLQTHGYFPIKNWYLTVYGEIPNAFNTNHYVKTDSFIEQFKSLVIVKSTTFSTNSMSEIIAEAAFDIGGGVVVNLKDNFFSKKDQIQKGQLFLYYTKETEEVKKIKKYLIDNKVEDEKKGIINLVCQSQNGFYLKEYTIKNSPIDFDANYNEDFKQVDKIIMSRLSKENDKGLVLLYGDPGTGKSSYIRRIINEVDDKRILYMPPDMTAQLSSPSLVPFLSDYSNSILIIEDAENVLIKRQGQHNQAISNILNMSDGLLGDCLNIQIVATFNTDLKNIDEALLRKGRLIAKYEFGHLTIDRIKKLSSTLGIKYKKEFKTVADVYNSDEMSFVEEKQTVGFKIKELRVDTTIDGKSIFDQK